MAKNEVFRWRTNPATIGQYWLAKDVPKGAEVTLKPNEACVVLEDGRVIGVATQSRMEVNPQIGLLKKAFGGKQPNRSFLFVLLGPHDLLLKVKGRTADGEEAQGVIGMRVTIEREDAPRLLRLPAKGESTIHMGHLVRLLEAEVNNVAARDFMSRLTMDQLKNSPEAQEEIVSSIRSAMRKTLQDNGLSFNTCWASWTQTEYERVLKMQQDYELAAQKHALIEQGEQDEMERIYRTNARRLELDHKLKMGSLTQAAREEIATEIATIRASSDLDEARWQNAIDDWERRQAHRTQVMDAESEMQKKAQNDAIEMAKLQVEEQRIVRAADAEVADADAAREQKTRLDQIQAERESLAMRLDSSRAEMSLEHEKAQADMALRQDQTEFQQKMTETDFDREQRQLDAEAGRREQEFDSVQEAKRRRQLAESAKEGSRLDSHKDMSDKVLGVLGDIAGGGAASDDVKMEALKQLSELRKADVSGSKDAYIEDDSAKKKE